ncbi:hypothetical protein [Nocardioides perillae]|uniref:Uncharacterized protein n=1 Tax=Nocardioides perillae TaxID=1119534 RepID=A0A7Y9RX33_9ACTN|nr:hypothetical protein [Nocardioides perillae]NYG55565.1 hypothetical protein [Nocardioides perillae]
MGVTAERPEASERWVAYDTALRPLVWGASTYTVVEIDQRVVAAAAAAGTRRVAGFVEDVAVNVGIARADVVPWAFFYAAPALRRRLGVPLGKAVRVRLRPVDPDVVPVPDDVREALERAGRIAALVACLATD